MYAQLSKVYSLLHELLTRCIYTYVCINLVGNTENTEFDVFLNVLHKT